MLAVLRNVTYRRLFAAQIVALIGTGLLTVALGLLAYDLAGRNAGAVLGTALTIKMLAYVGLAPVINALVARLPKKPVLIGADLGRAVLLAAEGRSVGGSLPLRLLQPTSQTAYGHQDEQAANATGQGQRLIEKEHRDEHSGNRLHQGGNHGSAAGSAAQPGVEEDVREGHGDHAEIAHQQGGQCQGKGRNCAKHG